MEVSTPAVRALKAGRRAHETSRREHVTTRTRGERIRPRVPRARPHGTRPADGSRLQLATACLAGGAVAGSILGGGCVSPPVVCVRLPVHRVCRVSEGSCVLCMEQWCGLGCCGSVRGLERAGRARRGGLTPMDWKGQRRRGRAPGGVWRQSQSRVGGPWRGSRLASTEQEAGGRAGAPHVPWHSCQVPAWRHGVRSKHKAEVHVLTSQANQRTSAVVCLLQLYSLRTAVVRAVVVCCYSFALSVYSRTQSRAASTRTTLTSRVPPSIGSRL